jgi:hypothetical protein
MKTLLRIFFILAVVMSAVFCALSAYLYITIQKETTARRAAEQQLQAQVTRAQQLEQEKMSIKRDLEDVVAVKQEVEKERDSAKEEARELSAQLETEKREKEILKKKLEEKQQAALALMKQLRLAREASAAGPGRVDELQAKVGELSGEKRELLEKLRTTEAERDQLNSKLEEMAQKDKPTIKLDDIFVRTELKFSGYVLTVNDKYNFVIINLGERDHLPVGEILIVHRGRKLIGKIRVDRVYDKMAAGAILPEWLQPGEYIQEDDSVKKF